MGYSKYVDSIWRSMGRDRLDKEELRQVLEGMEGIKEVRDRKRREMFNLVRVNKEKAEVKVDMMNWFRPKICRRSADIHIIKQESRNTSLLGKGE